MLSIDPSQLVSTQVEREGEGFGDGEYAPVGDPIEVWRRLQQPVLVTSDTGKKVYTQDGSVYVERGTDLRDGDRITLPEGTFKVVGPKQLDMNHPMNGHDFGWVRLLIRRV